MVKKNSISFCLFILCWLPGILFSQDIMVLVNEAKQFEASYKEVEALAKYKEVLNIQQSNYVALCKVSELYSLLGKRQTEKDTQKEYYQAARTYAQKALAVNGTHTEAHFVMALAMGRMAIISSGEEKIKAVKDIKKYAENCIKYDPMNFKGYHILGRWHFEVSDLSSVEKWLVKIAYGSLPEASLKEAVAFYEKSKQLNPGLLVNYLELAKCYHRKEDDKNAIAMLETLLKLPNKILDDATVKVEANKLLKKWKD